MRISPTTDLRSARESAETKRADAGRSRQPAEGIGAAVQHLPGENRQKDGVRPSRQADNRKKQQDRADGTKGSHIVPALAHLLQHAGLSARMFNGLTRISSKEAMTAK